MASEKDNILALLEHSPHALSLSQITAAIVGLSKRTAQRRLSELVADQQITASGKGPARRYAMAASSQNRPAAAQRATPDIPLSADSKDIIDYVNQHLTARLPVGYQQAFLNSYEPNKTFYLEAPHRYQLSRMGRTGVNTRPSGTYGRQVLDRLLIDLSWASSHLEGNTYSRLDTRRLIEQGNTAYGKAAFETQMILNHKAAIELLVDNADTVGFDRFTLLNLHSLLSENLLPNPADEGRLREHIVEIGQSVYRPLAIPAVINDCFELILDKASQINDPFEQSFFAMVHIPYLQPFADVNKRTSRLAANLPLLRDNLCPLTFLGVPEDLYSQAVLGVYELNRVELLRDVYMWAYERSTREYLVLKQDLVAPDPLRLTWRKEIGEIVKAVVVQPDRDVREVIDEEMSRHDFQNDYGGVRAIVIAQLKDLHEGVLHRFGLTPGVFLRWRKKQD